MQTATLILAGGAFACSAGSLFVMIKVRQDVLAAKAQGELELNSFKEKTSRNFATLRKAIINTVSDLEL